jgi:serine/threonine-protein kinase
MLGSLGCQSTKPSWWPGQKLAYSQSSPNPPQIQQQQAQQAQPYQPAPSYMDQTGYGQPQGTAAPPAGYPSNGYPIGHANAQDPYGTAGQTASGANAYPQGQPQGIGAYPEQYSGAANPYAQPGASTGGYPDAQTGYAAANPAYQQGGGNPYGATGATGGYNPTRTADARTAGGYSTNSPYDGGGYGGAGAADQGQYNSAGAAGGPPIANDPYQPGHTGYQPGQTGYNPAGTAPYQSPAAPYRSDPNAAGAGEAPYRPGSTKDFAPGAAGAATTGDYGQPPAAGAPAGYGNGSAYPATSAPGGYGGSSAYPNTPAAPAVDRYGRPIQQASGNTYDPTLQR